VITEKKIGSLEVHYPGELISRQEMFDPIWTELIVEEGYLTQHISMLRRTLGDDPLTRTDDSLDRPLPSASSTV
jgi:DNA-binding winged helix-turn-helix (wHTH) protein